MTEDSPSPFYQGNPRKRVKDSPGLQAKFASVFISIQNVTFLSENLQENWIHWKDFYHYFCTAQWRIHDNNRNRRVSVQTMKGEIDLRSNARYANFRTLENCWDFSKTSHSASRKMSTTTLGVIFSTHPTATSEKNCHLRSSYCYHTRV